MDQHTDRDSLHTEIGSGGGSLKIQYFTPRNEIRYAGFWIRVCALIMDSIILAVPLVTLGPLIYMAMEWLGPPGYVARRGEGLAQVTIIFYAWMYFAGMESSSYQATIGKQIVGVIVTDESGGALTFGRATMRLVCKFFSAVPLYLGFVVAAFSSQKQAVHDLIAGTLVVYDPDRKS
jgi:uncharacterized RDD family membrane protein YckC